MAGSTSVMGTRTTMRGRKSELDYVAIDIKGWSPPDGPVVIELHGPGYHFQPCRPSTASQKHGPG
jgi:hypothetical protein